MMGFYKIEDFLYEKFITTKNECNHLHENAYFPQFLLNLVKITEYDLSLLKYEIILWDNLRD
jgi:lipopolysaccharide biosynthesis protein